MFMERVKDMLFIESVARLITLKEWVSHTFIYKRKRA